MTPPTPGPVTLCAQCGLPGARGKQNATTPGVCASYCRQGRSLCQLRTIARMRPVVEAARAWFDRDESDPIGALAIDLGLVGALDAGGFIPPLTPEEMAEIREEYK